MISAKAAKHQDDKSKATRLYFLAMTISFRLLQYARLMRLDKPVGIILLLAPTLWGLWLASAHHPAPRFIAIFVVGVILMRGAGCVVNDMADRNFDRYVERTRHRPLAIGAVSMREAGILAISLGFFAFSLVLFCNIYTIILAFIGGLLALVYPFLKRIMPIPQLGLGLAFAWGVPMAFAAQTNSISGPAWLLFLSAAIWPLMYDTIYAMVDRADDLKVGVRSSAIFFNRYDVSVIALLQIILMVLWLCIGYVFDLHFSYYFCLVIVALLFLYQFNLIKDRDRERCFRAFLNNQWVGMLIFFGIFLSRL